MKHARNCLGVQNFRLAKNCDLHKKPWPVVLKPVLYSVISVGDLIQWILHMMAMVPHSNMAWIFSKSKTA